ncbi:MAG: MMPL family transporter, partial [Planctomycetaceae bacterium]|nr:MMPL family transporter [Planctomycetaceae bacterium]
VAMVLLTQLPMVGLALNVKCNNDTETWMPETTPARQRYEEYKRAFGAEEFLLIAFDTSKPHAPDAALIESMCGRLERLPGIRRVTSPDRMRAIMRDLQVPAEIIEQRLKGLLVGRDGHLVGVAASLSDLGLAHRAATVAEVRELLSYCQLDGSQTLMAGGPLFAAELDRLGGKEANAIYFTVTLLICLGLLYSLIREWRLTGLVYGVTLWTINATTVILGAAGGEMNFVLSSIPVLTMVLTMSISVHYLYYYQEALGEGAAQPIVRALQLAWRPTCIATLTTCLGELALSVSDIVPIRQFAYAASFSSVMAMIAGLGLTPALLVVCPTLTRRSSTDNHRGLWLANAIVSRCPKIVWATLLLTAITGIGLTHLQSDMTVSDFLPHGSRVKQDFLRINRELAATEDIEAVVNCGTDERPFVKKLELVRQIENKIRRHPAVDQTLSLTTFFPEELPSSPLDLARLLKQAESRQAEDNFTAHGQELWRISIRIHVPAGGSQGQVIKELTQQLAEEPVTLTGMTALVNSAQEEIFNSFSQSVFMAVGLITLAMMIFLKSIWRGFLAMVPNVAPLIWIYGGMSWLGLPIDIAIMLSGSIALGMSVDGTFHFMSRFRFHQRRAEAEEAARLANVRPVEESAAIPLTKESRPICSAEIAAKHALMESSIPFIQSTLTATAGMFGLTLSNFAPTARFGWVMIALMLAALVGDVLMLPALLKVTNRRRRSLVANLSTAGHSSEPSAKSAAA